MRVLVSAASRHGSTEEIAQEIAKSLRAGLPEADVEVIPLDRLKAVDGSDVLVLGSAIYMGRWLEPARTWVALHTEALSKRQVWIFSSGPIGNPPKPVGQSVDVAEMRRLTGARDHRVFAGRIERHELGFTERAVARLAHVDEGDFRDWPAVREWTAGIVAALHADATPRIG